jgi:cobalamin biosynthesis Mg chelatase CobN
MPTPSCTATSAGSVSDGSTTDRSKRYGNGQTAAQIAVSRNAPAGTEIRGPGNSQPHKVCKKANANGKQVWVDVHAVKNYTANQCAPSTSSSSTTTTTSCPTTTTSVLGVMHKDKLMTNEKSAHFTKHPDAKVTATSSVAGVCGTTTSTSTSSSASTSTSTSTSTSQTAGTTAAVVGQTAAGTTAAGAAPTAGGVAGVEATAPAGQAGGVAGALAEVGGVASGTLPFTGLPLWAVVLVALAAIAIGLALYRRSRPLTTRDVV